MFNCIKYDSRSNVTVFVTPDLSVTKIEWDNNMMFVYITEFIMLAGEIY